MAGRRALGLLVVALVAAGVASSATGRGAVESLTVTPNDTKPQRSKFQYDTPFTLIVSGRLVKEEGERTYVYDPLYLYGGVPKPIAYSSLLEVKPEKRSGDFDGGTLWDYAHTQQPYSEKHRYTIDVYPRDYGYLYFKVLTSSSARFSGSFNVRIVPKQEPQENLRVDFILKASGTPNVPIKGAATQPARASVSATGHATFTQRTGEVFTATETKGSASFSDGTRRLGLGILSGSKYYRASGRLVLLLKVNQSNDPKCEESGFLTGARAATLTVLPVSGSPTLGTLLFVGVPIPKSYGPFSVTPCKGYLHGWSGAQGANVRIVMKVSKV